MFVRAERSGDFYVYLHCLQRMLPIFHAVGHLNYAKFAHVDIQDRLKLFTSLNSAEHRLFITHGYFTFRRTEKFWSGICSDMTIEQVLVRSLSRIGGLAGGRGITATTIATCSQIVEAMEVFAGVRSVSAEQHVQLREANQKQNFKDLQTFISSLEEHIPVSKLPELSSLTIGVVEDEKINCDEEFQIGVVALKEIKKNSFSDMRLKRTLAVKPLATITKSVTIRTILYV
ncbi:hypothetical protein AVEN_210229-1 [Araneus ventricosus]|uniref:Uncharacterized protein n=1 Tax=Araneus ventricosus TaxID=182803 RepID=A0A4Y2FYN9_ARAVE|nr:hypothetical protein AVEN_210229-1 [Araneus ventricosus]